MSNSYLQKKFHTVAIQTAKSWKQKAIRLDCIVGNDVPVKVYTSFGFEYVDTVAITYADIGVAMQFKLYELLLWEKWLHCDVATFLMSQLTPDKSVPV